MNFDAKKRVNETKQLEKSFKQEFKDFSFNGMKTNVSENFKRNDR